MVMLFKTIVLWYSLSNFHTICDTMSQFNDGFKNIKKNISVPKSSSIKVITKCQNCHQILLSLRKEKIQKVRLISSCQEHLQIKLSILLMNQQFNVMFQLSKNTFKDDSKIKTITNKFKRNTRCTVSGTNFVYSLSFLRN